MSFKIIHLFHYNSQFPKSKHDIILIISSLRIIFYKDYQDSYEQID